MEAENRAFFDNLKGVIGIEFCVYDVKGALVYGVSEQSYKVDVQFNGVKTDKENNKTLVKLSAKSDEYVLCLEGADKAQEGLARLILELSEKTFTKHSILSCEDFYKALLFGELSMVDIGKYVSKYSVKEGTCCVMIVCAEYGINDAMAVVNAYSPDSKDFTVKLDEKTFALVKYMEDASGDYRSFAEYAEYIVQSVFDELGQNVFVAMGGTVKSIFDLAVSFSQASTAHRMAKANNSKTGVHTFKQYIIYRILEDLPRYKLGEYMKLLNDSVADEIFSDEEMLETAEEFLNNSLNQSETARKLFLHRNTLNYRLDKIEKSTGLNIRRFSDAVTFRLITVIRQLVK